MKTIGSNSLGGITSGISPDTIPLRIISFVREQLPAWRDDPNRPKRDSEIDLNPQLAKFLDYSARQNFPMVAFTHEEPQASGRHADLSASLTKSLPIGAHLYTIYDPILVIECKRLPAPSRDREKEYVTGSEPNRVSGGIQRFKLGYHGAKLNTSLMIGYVQAETPRHWYGEINGWIEQLTTNPIGDGCVWSQDDILQWCEEDAVKGIVSCASVHKRTGGVVTSRIEICHLWIVMNPEW